MDGDQDRRRTAGIDFESRVKAPFGDPHANTAWIGWCRYCEFPSQTDLEAGADPFLVEDHNFIDGYDYVIVIEAVFQ